MSFFAAGIWEMVLLKQIFVPSYFNFIDSSDEKQIDYSWIKDNNVCFRPWTGEKDYIKIVKRPHKGDDFCSTRIGMIFGKQYMVLNRNCYDYGEMMQVFFHAFGFLHENNHPEQEDYIKSQ